MKNDRAIDPTDNVMSLVAAEGRRQDDLRLAESKRVDDLQTQRSRYEDKLIVAESKRIDAIRAVDVAAVAIASERANQQAQVLATQVASSAEILRALVSSTASTIAQQLEEKSNQLSDRLTHLEKSQYEAKGLGGIPPQILERLDSLEKTSYQTEGKGEGMAAGEQRAAAIKASGRAMIFSVIAAIASMSALLIAFVKLIFVK